MAFRFRDYDGEIICWSSLAIGFAAGAWKVGIGSDWDLVAMIMAGTLGVFVVGFPVALVLAILYRFPSAVAEIVDRLRYRRLPPVPEQRDHRPDVYAHVQPILDRGGDGTETYLVTLRKTRPHDREGR